MSKAARPIGVTRKPTELEWVRLAAFLDGEGCIGIVGSKSRQWTNVHMHLSVVISNTDRRMTDWCHDVFGGAIYESKRQDVRWKPCFRWVISCQQAKWVLEGCLAHFLVKREQADIALEFTETLNRWGVNGAPESVQLKQWKLKTQLSELKGRFVSSKYNRLKPSKSAPEKGEQKEKVSVQ